MLHSSLTLCISIQQRKRHTRKAISELQLMPGTQSLSLPLPVSLAAWQLLCLGGNPLRHEWRTRKNALRLLCCTCSSGTKKPLRHRSIFHINIHIFIRVWQAVVVVVVPCIFSHHIYRSLPLSLSLCLLVAVSGSTTTIYHISITWLINHATHIFQQQQR